MKNLLLALAVCSLPLSVGAQRSQMRLEAEVSEGENEGEWIIGIALNNKDDVVALQMDVELPDSVTDVEVTKTSRTDGLTLMYNRKQNGMLRIMAYSQGGTPIKGRYGEVLIVNAKVAQWPSGKALHLRGIHLTLKGNKDMKLPDAEYTL